MAKGKKSRLASLKKSLRQLPKSVWFFPLLLLIPLFILTALKINGSSVGIYHSYLFGNLDDSNSIYQEPRGIRSDEWLVNTQLTIAQDANGYERVNDNTGDGQDTSIIVDVPYKGWSIFFKPHNLVFFVLPFEFAFAMRWWLMGYLLIVSCYFFVDTVFPRNRWFASLFALSLFFTPFVQWWYLYGTLGVLYYSLFAVTISIKLLGASSQKQRLLWGGLLAFVLTCFAFLLYPPFQIATAFVMAATILGFMIEKLRKKSREEIIKVFLIFLGAALTAIAMTAIYLATRQEAVSAILNTVYPGQRTQASGGFNLIHLLSGSFNVQLQYADRAAQYVFKEVGVANQSEASGFILLLPYLIIPGIFQMWRSYSSKKYIDWPLILTSGLTFLFAIRLFIPRFNSLFALMQLDKVPHKRLLIGLGLLSVIYVVLFIRNLSSQKKELKVGYVAAYSALVFISQITLGLAIKHKFPAYIGYYKIIAISLVLSGIIFLLLRKHFVMSALLLLLFSFISAGKVNPLYRGLGIVTDTDISNSITSIAKSNSGKWATEGLIFENIAAASGAPSLNGVYIYPQLEIWEDLDNGDDQAIYNRYAHVFFNFDKDPSVVVETKAKLTGGDNFHISTEPCSEFLMNNDVRYIITLAELDGQDNCTEFADKVSYPGFTFFIYRLNY